MNHIIIAHCEPLTARMEKKCFVWKHKVHVIDPGISSWALPARDWLAERRRARPTGNEARRTVARPYSTSVFLTSVNAVVSLGADSDTLFIVFNRIKSCDVREHLCQTGIL